MVSDIVLKSFISEVRIRGWDVLLDCNVVGVVKVYKFCVGLCFLFLN